MRSAEPFGDRGINYVASFLKASANMIIRTVIARMSKLQKSPCTTVLRLCRTTHTPRSNLGFPKDMADDSKKLKSEFTLRCKQGIHFLSIRDRLLVNDREQVQKSHTSIM
jgi:hypothetical protein